MLLVVLNMIFAACVCGLLMYAGVDLSVFLAAACFVLSFIPELGSIICMILPAPFVLLNPTKHCTSGPSCISDFRWRCWNLFIVTMGMVALKFLVSNLLYSQMMGRTPKLGGAIKDAHD